MVAKFVITALFLVCIPLSAPAQEDVYDRMDALDTISLSLMRNGKFGEALDSCRVLLSLTESVSQPREKAKACNMMAVCFKELGEYDKADICYRRSIDLAGNAKKDDYRYSYSCFLLLVGGWQKAIDCLSEITAPKLELHKILNLSSAYFRRNGEGDTARALSLLDEYLDTHSPEDADYPTALQNKGYIYWDTGDAERADSCLEAALDLMSKDESGYYVTLANLAVVRADRKDFDRALGDIESVLRYQAAAPGIGTRHPDYVISLRKKAEILLKAEKAGKAGKRSDVIGAFKDYCKGEKQYIYSVFPGATPEFRLSYWYSRKPFFSEVFQLGGTAPEFLLDAALFRRQMTLLASTDSTAADFRKDTGIVTADIRKALKSDETAVEFVSYYDQAASDTVYAALVCPPSGSVRYRHIATKKELHRYRLRNGTTLEEGVCSLDSKVKGVIYTDSTLARMIWDPVLEAVPKATKKIYFAPDGILQMLGIENLPHEGISDREIHRLTSTARLPHRSGAAGMKKNSKALVIGGVNYDAGGGEKADGDEANHLAYNYMKDDCGLNFSGGLFSYLKGSRTEADSIIKKLSLTDDGGQGRCSEKYVKENMGKYGLVHLSTHGYSLKVDVGRLSREQSDSVPDMTLLASGIALEGANVAGPGGEKEDGLLSAREMCDLEGLENVDLIVLSACQTAQGVVSDEGPAGIVRGLKKAGAGAVMASLWPVNDEATALFMNAFYEALSKDGCTKYAALRRAQEAVRGHVIKASPMRFSPKTLSSRPVSDDTGRRTEFRPYGDPYFWAPFILIDDI